MGQQRSLSRILTEDGEHHLLTTDETAKLLRLTSPSLRRLRQEGQGPKWIRVGSGQGRVFYRASAIADYLDVRTEAAVGSE